MEKKTKKTTSKPASSKTVKAKKTINTKTTKKKTTKKKRSKGFTLIELLAVIIILGVLMIIAIPSVTTYISNSRDSAYASTVQEAIGGARTLVNSGKLETYDRDTTYYIPMSCIPTESGLQTPYGNFDEAYILVTYNGDGYDYYFTGKDTSNVGINKITKYEDINADIITKDVKLEDIKLNVGIDGRGSIVIFNDNCNSKETFASELSYNTKTKEVGEIPLKFTIDGYEFEFSSNMTWQDWLASSYNTYSFKYDDYINMIYSRIERYGCWQQHTLANFYVISNSNNSPVRPGNTIIRNGEYHSEWWSVNQNSGVSFGDVSPGYGIC